MPKVLLTDIVARTVKPIDGRRFTLWDTKVPGFGLRVSAETKTWTVMVDRRARRRITVGRYPAMGLQDARLEARRLINAAALIRSLPGVTPISFSAALEKFVELHLSQNRRTTAKERERVLRKYFEGRWKHRMLADIQRSELITILDRLRDTPVMANNVFAIIRLFFRWALRRGYVPHSPCEAMQAPAKRRSRDRVLSRDELRKVLIAARSSGTFGTIVTLLVFTGQRRGEIAAMNSAWINAESLLLTIPKHVAKNGHEHQVPITPFLLGLLPNRDGILFPARGHDDVPFNGWSVSMNTFRRACGVKDFTLHDLRRTAATIMAEELSVLPHVIERLLNHITGTISPVGRIYNRARYLPEVRRALLAYERYLRALAPLPGDNIEAKATRLLHYEHDRGGHGEPGRA